MVCGKYAAVPDIQQLPVLEKKRIHARSIGLVEQHILK
jgi:hypothetical protein